jgi:hypothetical protein
MNVPIICSESCESVLPNVRDEKALVTSAVLLPRTHHTRLTMDMAEVQPGRF